MHAVFTSMDKYTVIQSHEEFKCILKFFIALKVSLGWKLIERARKDFLQGKTVGLYADSSNTEISVFCFVFVGLKKDQCPNLFTPFPNNKWLTLCLQSQGQFWS